MFFNENLGEEWKWCKKKQSTNIFENYTFVKHFDQKHKILMLVSHKNFIIEYFNERNMSNERERLVKVAFFSSILLSLVNGTCHPIS